MGRLPHNCPARRRPSWWTAGSTFLASCQVTGSLLAPTSAAFAQRSGSNTRQRVSASSESTIGRPDAPPHACEGLSEAFYWAPLARPLRGAAILGFGRRTAHPSNGGPGSVSFGSHSYAADILGTPSSFGCAPRSLRRARRLFTGRSPARRGYRRFITSPLAAEPCHRLFLLPG